MMDIILALLYTLLLWWFSTGLIIYLDGLSRRTFPYSMLGATVVMLVGYYGLNLSADDTTVHGAYLAFTSALLVWGWLEISFYMGYITGPRQQACEPACAGWQHFGHAVQVSLYHELAIVVAATLVLTLTQGSANHVGAWTFLVLWCMHESARLNVFLGVRNLNAEFLPEHLQYLRSFLNEKAMNLLFPVSVTIATAIAAQLVLRVMTADGVSEAVGLTFVTSLLLLGLLEHWFLILPLPFSALWKWSLRPEASESCAAPDHITKCLSADNCVESQGVVAEYVPKIFAVCASLGRPLSRPVKDQAKTTGNGRI